MANRRKRFTASSLPIQAGTDHGSEEGDSYVIDVSTDVTGAARLNFDKWLGRGIDPWVHAFVQQLRVFLQSKTVTRRTVNAYGRSGVMIFLDFLVLTGATYTPNEIDRRRIEQFIEWLKSDSTATQKASTQKGTYSHVKAVLKGLARRGVIPRDRNLFPAAVFRGTRRDIEGETPFSQAERAQLAEALRTDVIALHHRPNEFGDSDALVIYALALCLRTGLNTTPMLELGRDALSRHPFFPKMGLLTSFKRRNHRAHSTSLAGESIRDTAAVPVDAVALFNKLLERTRPLAESAPAALRNVLWLYRVSSTCKRGELRRFNTPALYARIQAFVSRHKLCTDDGRPLRINNQRLRATMENRLWKLSNGDLFTISLLMGHDPAVADRSYLAVTAEMRVHATIVGEALPDIYRGGSIHEQPRMEATPVGTCKDSLYGEKAPSDGTNHCTDFLSCFRCRSYAVVGSDKDLHRLFSFYWFLAEERTRIGSRAWKEHFAYLMSLIDAFTLDKFDNRLVKRAKRRAKADPLTFWKNYQMPYSSVVVDAN